MKDLTQISTIRAVLLVLCLLILTACGGNNGNGNNDDDGANGDTSGDGGDGNQTPPAEVSDATFEVTITNLTRAQPMSPVAIMLHQTGFNSFTDGQPASPGLELLAEGGDNTDVLAEVEARDEHLASGSTDGPIPPATIGDPVNLTFPSDQLEDMRISVITMLVHTNDAFSGVNAVDISNMEVGDTIALTGPTWDAGTEINDELGANLPGPDFGGEGFNGARDDLFDRVRFHQGVVTNTSLESGLADSSLEERHRFDNPTTKIVVSRIE